MPPSSPKIIPLCDLSHQHQLLKTDICETLETLLERGDFVLGQALKEFETDFAAACGVADAVGVGSGTDAIALGLIASGITAGDEVILPANTFVATLIGVLRAGATPVLVDCDPQTALMDLAAAAAAITPRTRVILPVHLYGQMVSPGALKALADSHNLLIFEDASQAHLAKREGYRAGAVGVGAAFSFYPSKNLGSLGDGGIVTTCSDIVAYNVRTLRNYGARYKYHHVHSAGINSRLDTFQAAVLKLKLPHLLEWNCQRSHIAQYYNHRLAELTNYGILPFQNVSGSGHVYHLYVIRITDACPLRRGQLQESLKHAGIQTSIHYPIPCHLQPAFSSLGYQPGQFPITEKLSQEILSLPIYPGMQMEQVDRIVNSLREQLSCPGAVPITFTE